MHSVVLLFVYSSICILVTGLPYSDESGSEDILRDDELRKSSDYICQPYHGKPVFGTLRPGNAQIGQSSFIDSA